MYGGVTGKVREDLPMSIIGRAVALRVACAVRRPRRRANSLRSDSARLFPVSAALLGHTTRPGKTTEKQMEK